MALLPRFDPPAFLTDLDHIQGGRQAWDDFMVACFEWAISDQKKVIPAIDGKPGTVQFFNPRVFDSTTTLIEQPILWNAFPKTLLLRYGRERAMIEADSLWPFFPLNGFPNAFDSAVPGTAAKAANTTAWTRPLDEYCEWRVERDPATALIRRITFTSEPPEYWTALFGGEVVLDDNTSFRFEGDPEFATRLYRELTGQPVETDDLRVRMPFAGFKRGDYNPYNKWNTTHGIVHLCCPPNSIGAEVHLGADATILYARADKTPVTSPDELICCARYGGVNRNSDPTIGACVNALARLGAMVTLVNPVGLYMDDVDTSGWSLPDGIAPTDCVRVVRGQPGRIERLVVEVPEETGRTVSDLTIGGVPVRYGGQVAECITVKLVGGACMIGSAKNEMAGCTGQACLAPKNANMLQVAPADGFIPPGLIAAFSQSRSVQAASAMVAGMISGTTQSVAVAGAPPMQVRQSRRVHSGATSPQ
jgi:hypothetical protein